MRSSVFAVHAMVGKFDVVDADDLAAVGVNDLLVEQVLLHGEPGFVGMIKLERRFVGGELQAARGHGGDLVVARDERAVLPAADQEARDAVRLLVGDDEHLLDAADKIAERIVGFGAEDFGCVNHVMLLLSVSQTRRSTRDPSSPSFPQGGD